MIMTMITMMMIVKVMYVNAFKAERLKSAVLIKVDIPGCAFRCFFKTQILKNKKFHVCATIK